MKKVGNVIFLSFICFIVIVVNFGKVQASSVDSELDLFTGDWYDEKGKMYASIHDGYFNQCPMKFVTIAGGPANYAMTVQIHESAGYRHISLQFSRVREGNDRFNPFWKPITFINNVRVHKKNFRVPDKAYQDLEGDWYDKEKEFIARIENKGFNKNEMFFISFYGTQRRYCGVLQVNGKKGREYFEVYKPENGIPSLVNIKNQISLQRLPEN